MDLWGKSSSSSALMVKAADGAAAGEQQDIPVPYRYDLTPLESFKANCYKPNPLGANCDHESHKPWTLGAVMIGNFDRLPRQSTNKTVSLVWEARRDSSFLATM